MPTSAPAPKSPPTIVKDSFVEGRRSCDWIGCCGRRWRERDGQCRQRCDESLHAHDALHAVGHLGLGAARVRRTFPATYLGTLSARRTSGQEPSDRHKFPILGRPRQHLKTTLRRRHPRPVIGSFRWCRRQASVCSISPKSVAFGAPRSPTSGRSREAGAPVSPRHTLLLATDNATPLLTKPSECVMSTCRSRRAAPAGVGGGR